MRARKKRVLAGVLMLIMVISSLGLNTIVAEAKIYSDEVPTIEELQNTGEGKYISKIATPKDNPLINPDYDRSYDNYIVRSNGFIHPGILMNREELNIMRDMVWIGAEPWTTAFESLLQSPYASLGYNPDGPFEVIASDAETYSLDRASTAVYEDTLLWYITGNEEYAKKAIDIIMGWCDTVTADTKQDHIRMGVAVHKLCIAAEILKFTPSSGWTEDNTTKFSNFIDLVNPSVDKAFQYYNQGLYALMGYMGKQIFQNNWDGYETAVERLTVNKNFGWKGGNSVNYAISSMIFNSGTFVEMGRDQEHAWDDLGCYGCLLQTTYIQNTKVNKKGEIVYLGGENLFEYDNEKVLKAAATWQRYCLGEEVPYVPYKNAVGQQVEWGTNSDVLRGRTELWMPNLYYYFRYTKGYDDSAAREILPATELDPSEDEYVTYGDIYKYIGLAKDMSYANTYVRGTNVDFPDFQDLTFTPLKAITSLRETPTTGEVEAAVDKCPGLKRFLGNNFVGFGNGERDYTSNSDGRNGKIVAEADYDEEGYLHFVSSDVNNGEWVAYNVDFEKDFGEDLNTLVYTYGINCTNNPFIDVYVSEQVEKPKQADYEAALTSGYAGTLELGPTGGYSSFKSFAGEMENIELLKGKKTVYFYFRGSNNIYNFHGRCIWFKFVKDSDGDMICPPEPEKPVEPEPEKPEETYEIELIDENKLVTYYLYDKDGYDNYMSALDAFDGNDIEKIVALENAIATYNENKQTYTKVKYEYRFAASGSGVIGLYADTTTPNKTESLSNEDISKRLAVTETLDYSNNKKVRTTEWCNFVDEAGKPIRLSGDHSITVDISHTNIRLISITLSNEDETIQKVIDPLSVTGSGDNNYQHFCLNLRNKDWGDINDTKLCNFDHEVRGRASWLKYTIDTDEDLSVYAKEDGTKLQKFPMLGKTGDGFDFDVDADIVTYVNKAEKIISENPGAYGYTSESAARFLAAYTNAREALYNYKDGLTLQNSQTLASILRKSIESLVPQNQLLTIENDEENENVIAFDATGYSDANGSFQSLNPTLVVNSGKTASLLLKVDGRATKPKLSIVKFGYRGNRGTSAENLVDIYPELPCDEVTITDIGNNLYRVQLVCGKPGNYRMIIRAENGSEVEEKTVEVISRNDTSRVDLSPEYVRMRFASFRNSEEKHVDLYLVKQGENIGESNKIATISSTWETDAQYTLSDWVKINWPADYNPIYEYTLVAYVAQRNTFIDFFEFATATYADIYADTYQEYPLTNEEVLRIEAEHYDYNSIKGFEAVDFNGRNGWENGTPGYETGSIGTTSSDKTLTAKYNGIMFTELDEQRIPVEKITIENADTYVKKNETLSLLVTVTPENATSKKVAYISSKPGVARVYADGTVEAVAKGATEISALNVDSVSNTVTIFVADVEYLNALIKAYDEYILGHEAEYTEETAQALTEAYNKANEAVLLNEAEVIYYASEDLYNAIRYRLVKIVEDVYEEESDDDDKAEDNETTEDDEKSETEEETGGEVVPEGTEEKPNQDKIDEEISKIEDNYKPEEIIPVPVEQEENQIIAPAPVEAVKTENHDESPIEEISENVFANVIANNTVQTIRATVTARRNAENNESHENAVSDEEITNQAIPDDEIEIDQVVVEKETLDISEEQTPTVAEEETKKVPVVPIAATSAIVVIVLALVFVKKIKDLKNDTNC